MWRSCSGKACSGAFTKRLRLGAHEFWTTLQHSLRCTLLALDPRYRTLLSTSFKFWVWLSLALTACEQHTCTREKFRLSIKITWQLQLYAAVLAIRTVQLLCKWRTMFTAGSAWQEILLCLVLLHCYLLPEVHKNGNTFNLKVLHVIPCITAYTQRFLNLWEKNAYIIQINLYFLMKSVTVSFLSKVH